MNTQKYKKIFNKLKPYLSALFLALVGYLVYESLSEVSWEEVKSALFKVSIPTVLLCFALAMLNYLILSSYDYLGFRYLKIPKINYKKIYPSAFISYAFNLNLGALVGGLGFRYRIYSGWGVDKSKIPLIMLFSTLSNWLGYTVIISFILFFRTREIQNLISLPTWSIYLCGGLTFSISLGYLFLCLRRFELNIKKIHFKFPEFKMALTQLALSMGQWLIASTIIYLLLQSFEASISFEQVLFTAMIASVAGVLTHVPAGLGVLEAVFLRMNFEISSSLILVALLSYRFVYYLLPLFIAIPSYLSLEYFQKK